MPSKAEMNFREAFERLKIGRPHLLPPGTVVSQNNVAKEAGRDPTALRKTRFPSLVDDIQAYLASPNHKRPVSERQRLIKARQVSRSKSELIDNLKAQRDDAVSRVAEVDELVVALTVKVRDLEAKLNSLQPRAGILPMKPFAEPKLSDIHGDTLPQLRPRR